MKNGTIEAYALCDQSTYDIDVGTLNAYISGAHIGELDMAVSLGALTINGQPDLSTSWHHYKGMAKNRQSKLIVNTGTLNLQITQ